MDFTKMSVRQLRQYIKEKQLFKNYQTMKKIELINKINDIEQQNKISKLTEEDKKLIIQSSPFDLTKDDFKIVKQDLKLVIDKGFIKGVIKQK